MAVLKPEAIEILAATRCLAVKKAKQAMQGLYHTYPFAFTDNQLGSFKVMLITITRSCVHFVVFI